MNEYRFFDDNEELVNLLEDDGLAVIEEDFKDGRSFVVYAGKDLSAVFERFGARYEAKDVDDTGWDEKWKEYLRPGMLTESIGYYFDEKDRPEGLGILINPALAFGTGTHPTTRIAASLAEPVVKGKTVLDAGCGSGILAIAASICGADKVYAFDIDPQAIPNALENIERNGVKNSEVWAGTLEGFRGEADVIIANIISSVLLSINDEITSRKPEFIIYSGILVSEMEEFLSKADLSGYELEERVTINEWTGARFRLCSQ
ncbi:50S ribosomal protein L11 methyltransferase [Limisalsivibrio acetivorans]|uniref:50S ribosomal protein L11 methyltransferase n=1 Tax=Limisalsivibrio acetivorans TaxID=1304888 RepID=UPI0003B4DF79|nr:50S ribosomal protein L11 methyltransferase [Limisalsivibrio acetivorans]